MELEKFYALPLPAIGVQLSADFAVRMSKRPSIRPSQETPGKARAVRYFEKDAKGEVREMPVEEGGDDVETEDMKALEASVLALARIEKPDAILYSLNQKSAFLEK